MNALAIVRGFYPSVKHVKDAGRSLRIDVNGKDVDAPGVKKHKGCALAVACKRMSGVDGAIISVGTAYLVKGDVAIRYKVSQSIAREIVSFDRSGIFAPGEYWLDKPAYKLGTPALTGSENRRKRPTKKTGFRHLTQGIRSDLRTPAQA